MSSLSFLTTMNDDSKANEYDPRSNLTYIEWQIQQSKTQRKFIEEASNLISDIVIEGFLKEIQSSVDENRINTFKIFQLIPLTVIHLSYKYSKEFKEYLLLHYHKTGIRQSTYNLTQDEKQKINAHCRSKENGSTMIKMFSIKQFTNNYAAVRLDQLRKNLIKIKPAQDYDESISSGGGWKGYTFIPHLNINKSVRKRLNLDNNERNVQCGIIRQFQSTQNLQLLYFNSPYYYQYNTGNDKDEYTFNRFGLPQLTRSGYGGGRHSGWGNYTNGDLQSVIYLEQQNSLFKVHSNCMDILDISCMKWKSKHLHDGAVQFVNNRRNSSTCVFGDRLFISGGDNASDSVEMVNCAEFKDIDWEQQKHSFKSIKLDSKINCNRQYHGSDTMIAKNGIVIGGGQGKNKIYATNTVELYDTHKDKWMLLEAMTKNHYKKAKVWVSGNLIFITDVTSDYVTQMGTIEYIDIRDNSMTASFGEIDKKMEKLFDFYRIKHKWSIWYQGLHV